MTAQESSGRPTALFVCEDIPVAGLSGPATYNLAIFNALLACGYAIDVLVTTPRLQLLENGRNVVPGARRVDFVHGRAVGGGVVPTSWPGRLRLWKRRAERFGLTLPKRGGDGVARIGRMLTDAERSLIGGMMTGKSYDLVLIDTIYRASALDVLPQAGRTLLVAHDVFSERAASFNANGFRAISSLDEEAERTLWRRFDAIAAISPADEARIRADVDGPVRTILPVIEAAGPLPASATGGRRILYLGTPAYHNVDGLRWFLTEVWPQVRVLRPDAALDVVGSIATAFPDAVAGVVFHGRVDDLGALAADAAFAINPVRMGSGIKIKMIDYFTLGLPCIASNVGAAGFPTEPEPPFAEASTADDFTALIVDWLAAPDRVQAYAARIAAYLGLFTGEAAATVMADLVEAPR